MHCKYNFIKFTKFKSSSTYIIFFNTLENIVDSSLTRNSVFYASTSFVSKIHIILYSNCKCSLASKK